MYCALKLNEFNNIEDNVVIFKGTDVKNYTRANWNAVIFYTYLYHNIWKKQTSVNDIVKFVQNKYKGYDLSRSILDVEKYLSELFIDEYVVSIICGEYTDIESINCETSSNIAQFICKSAIINYDNKIIDTPICLHTKDGKIGRIETLCGIFETIDEFFNVSNLTQLKQYEQNKGVDIGYQLLNKEDIHDLPNSYTVNGQTYTNKCYMMATFETLHSSPTIRKLVDELNVLPDKYWYNELDLNISHTLKKIFTNIENCEKDIAVLCNKIIEHIEESSIVNELHETSGNTHDKIEKLRERYIGKSSYRSNEFNSYYAFFIEILEILEIEAIKKKGISLDFAEELRSVTFKENIEIRDKRYKFISNIACESMTGYDFSATIRTKGNKWYEVSSFHSSVSYIGDKFGENNEYAKYGKYRTLVIYELID